MPAAWGLAVLSFVGVSAAPAAQDTARLHALLTAEDARPRDSVALAPLLDAARSRDTQVVRLALRALGRQERADLLEFILPGLSRAEPAIRAEAANAIGQSVVQARSADARRSLEDRVALESDPFVLGVLLRTLGRLPVATTAEREHTETLLVRASRALATDTSGAVLEGAAHGLHSLYRKTATDRLATGEGVERLVELLAPANRVLVRRLALAAIVAGRRVDSGILLQALQDPDREVRRLALQAAVNLADLPGRERVVHRAWSDPDPAVRFEALRAFGDRLVAGEGCAPIIGALNDADPHVRLRAIDLLARCGPGAISRLMSLVRDPLSQDGWQVPAHALVALARVSPATTDSVLPRFVSSPVWWARMYGARAADSARIIPVLYRLARDRHPNVREAAISGLSRHQGHVADSVYLAALESDDYQLLRTAAQALVGTPGTPGTLGTLLRALNRVSRQQRETSRDPRVALLTAIGSIGGREQADALRPYLTDFDPVIATQAAELMGRWTGTRPQTAPRIPSRAPVPSWNQLTRMEGTTLTFVMRGGGRVVMRLRPFDAPTNVARLVRIARTHWFDGRTFHRVVPNFVIQGGSPGANEYMGDGAYTRDELTLVHHLRGTVGISTRGRDTGDGQIFVNLVDNWRLDHDYTIVAEVVEGMEVVDRVLEGAVIDRVEVVER